MLIVLSSLSFAQSLNMNLVGTWDANMSTDTTYNSVDVTNYNDCWGWSQDGKEYVVIGSNVGSHIIDVTNPSTPQEVDFVRGKFSSNAIHRDYKTHKGYLFMVCDQGPSSLQVADLSYLPDSVHVVYDEDSFIVKSHNIFIDTLNERLYSCGGTKQTGGNDLSIFDISTPSNPILLIDLKDSIPWWGSAVGYVHDIHVKNNIGFTHDEDAMHVIDFTNVNSPVILGSLNSYPDQGYNHSGWLNEDDTTYVMLDETPGKRVKFLDVSDYNNIQVTDLIDCNTSDTAELAHNSFFKDDLAYTSYYSHGVYVFDASDRNDIKIAAYYDPYNDTNSALDNCWGVYPYLPSNIIIASDINKGLVILNSNYIVSIKENEKSSFKLYPNPVNTGETVNFSKPVNYEVYSISGQFLFGGKNKSQFLTSQMSTGYYIVKINDNFTKLIVK